MRKAKKLIAGIMLACMFIAGTGVEPSDVYAAGTTAGSLEMKTASDSINLNAGQSFDVTCISRFCIRLERLIFIWNVFPLKNKIGFSLK